MITEMLQTAVACFVAMIAWDLCSLPLMKWLKSKFSQKA